jgi:hypothetical protein
MTNFGFTLMTEQSGPKQLVDYAVRAEAAGFDFAVSSDHYFPWLESMGHAPYAWTVLGAVAQATDRIELMTYVTCPTIRYHPAVVAQKAATLAVVSRSSGSARSATTSSRSNPTSRRFGSGTRREQDTGSGRRARSARSRSAGIRMRAWPSSGRTSCSDGSVEAGA